MQFVGVTRSPVKRLNHGEQRGPQRNCLFNSLERDGHDGSERSSSAGPCGDMSRFAAGDEWRMSARWTRNASGDVLAGAIGAMPGIVTALIVLQSSGPS